MWELFVHANCDQLDIQVSYTAAVVTVATVIMRYIHVAITCVGCDQLDLQTSEANTQLLIDLHVRSSLPSTVVPSTLSRPAQKRKKR